LHYICFKIFVHSDRWNYFRCVCPSHFN